MINTNASHRPTAELVELHCLDGDPDEWAVAMMTLRDRFGVPVLGWLSRTGARCQRFG